MHEIPGLDERPEHRLAVLLTGASFSSSWREAVLVCAGDLDLGTRPDLHRELDRVVSGAVDGVIVDIAAVSFLDCGAISEFVAARDTCRAAGGDLFLRSPTAITRRMLRMLKLNDLIVDDAADGAPRASGPGVEAPATVGLADQVQAGNRASIVIEQARGIIAEYFDVSVDDATHMLRALARRRGQTTAAVAAKVVDRTAELADLGGHDVVDDPVRGETNVGGPVAAATGRTP